ncbi:hypothetical protein BBJ28_00005972 [Nothophytophthora sp. Chile5]|nr:hypothetical protein BBJ28_00005972 [Nothophytophthora sp. Chile5]
MEDERRRLTVAFGKQTAELQYAPDDAQAVAQLKEQVAERFGIAPQYQKLVYRGKEVGSTAKNAAPSSLPANCKLMLLLNGAYHAAVRDGKVLPSSSSIDCNHRESATASTAGSTTSNLVEELEKHSEASASPSPLVSRVKHTPAIDASELADDVVLMQLFRGKNGYDFIFPRSERVLDVKKKLSLVLGMSSPQALRLVIKGKTPSDETLLGDVAQQSRSVKCMVLLQAQQHVVLEKEEELRGLLNELAQSQAALQRVERQMARNFTSREESLLQLSRVLDDSQRIAANLGLVQHHLSGGSSGAATKAAKPRASTETLAALAESVQEARKLTEAAQKLLERHSSV